MGAFFTCFNRKSLETVLPHRGAALKKIDGIFYHAEASETIRGIKEINADDQDLEGHFPGARPIPDMPRTSSSVWLPQFSFPSPTKEA